MEGSPFPNKGHAGPWALALEPSRDGIGYPGGMRLLLLGGLGPYPERVRAFQHAGHAIWYAATHYLPAVRDRIAEVPAFALDEQPLEAALDRVEALIRSERIDLVYSLLNAWDGSNRATAALLRRGCPVPLVRHYKEHYVSPTDDERACIEQSDGVIFINEPSRDYFAGLYRQPRRTTCLDADPIPRRYLEGRLRPKLSALDGRAHVLIAGSAQDDGGRYDYRATIRELGGHGAHVHLYGQFRRLDPTTGWLLDSVDVEAAYRALAGEGDYLHIHPTIPPTRFVEEWSAYDAGLLHVADPSDRFRAFNYPNRYTAYLAAGVPVALAAGEMPPLQSHLEALGCAVVYDDLADLVSRLPEPAAARAALEARHELTFEAIFPALEAFLRSCLG